MSAISILITSMIGTYLCIDGMPDDGHPTTLQHRRSLTIGIGLLVACVMAAM